LTDNESVRLLLDQPNTIAALEKADPGDPGIADLIQQAKEINPSLSTVGHFQAMSYGDLTTTTDVYLSSD
jgi:hypothetical protein